MPVIKVMNRDLKEQLVRNGFVFAGSQGDGISRPIEYTLVGDAFRLSNREKDHVHIVSKLSPKSVRHNVRLK